MSLAYQTMLPTELAECQAQAEEYARGHGLDFFPTIFEMVDIGQLNQVAAYGGFPTRFPHWRFGMEYERLSKGYAYGLQKIYELVINNDPCYAYLLDSNSLTDQKLVMAHVYGHCDFFKNNSYFSLTNRKMMDQMANHGNRIRGYMDRFGVEEVELFIDACLSIEDLIDIHSPFIQRQEKRNGKYNFEGKDKEGDESQGPGRFEAKNYMDRFINPPERLDSDEEKTDTDHIGPFPAKPQRDVMLFLLRHAPLKAWQADVLSILRDEAYYFAPQAQTKIMNEGWASYWHSTIMTTQSLTAEDLIHYADHHSGTMASSPQRLNPYKLGIELLRDIEERWDKGRFGPDYEQCDDLRAKRDWDTGAGLGKEKIFEVRRIHNDLTFIDEFLTLEFCRKYKIFQFGYNEHTDYYEIESREFPRIKEQLLFSLTNRGQPITSPDAFVDFFRRMDPTQKGFVYQQVRDVLAEEDPEKANDQGQPMLTGSRPDDATTPEAPPLLHQQSRIPTRVLHVHKSYIVTEDEEGIVIVDQHALHERVMFEQLCARVISSDGNLESQRLLMPVIMDLGEKHQALIEDLAPLLERIGIEAVPAGPGAIGIQAFPSFLFERKVSPTDFMTDLLDRAEEGQLDLAGSDPKHLQVAVLQEVLNMMACKAAVKAGDQMSGEELEQLLERRDQIERSSNCPHGRPTSIRLSLRELEKQFKRT